MHSQATWIIFGAMLAICLVNPTSTTRVSARRQPNGVLGKRCTKANPCRVNFHCVNSKCHCPAPFVLTKTGGCVQPNTIVFNNSTAASGPYGWPNCIPNLDLEIPGLIVRAPNQTKFWQNCDTFVIGSRTLPNDIHEFTDPINSYLDVDRLNGTVYFNGGPNQASYPCGPPASHPLAKNGSQSVIQTYALVCKNELDVRSNALLIDVEFPSCDVKNGCSAKRLREYN